MGFAAINASLSIPGYILGESALSLLGLGIQEPAASWGNLLSQAMDPQNILHYPWVLIPGVFISVAVMSFNFIGDHLRDRLRTSATRRGVTETELIQEAVQAYLAGEKPPAPGSCLELVQDLCGSLDGPADLSTGWDTPAK